MIKLDVDDLIKKLLQHSLSKKDIVDMLWTSCKGEMTLSQIEKHYASVEDDLHKNASLDQCSCHCPNQKPKDHAVNCVYRINCLK